MPLLLPTVHQTVIVKILSRFINRVANTSFTVAQTILPAQTP